MGPVAVPTGSLMLSEGISASVFSGVPPNYVELGVEDSPPVDRGLDLDVGIVLGNLLPNVLVDL